ncbi:MAG TPA: hypothetical protein VL095_09820 [Flavisolibacter sp.]|nr:hypothetical protein [Flavisolibacter sp.]
MNKITTSLLVLLLSTAYVEAQDKDCPDRQLAKAGKWTNAPEQKNTCRRLLLPDRNPLFTGLQSYISANNFIQITV